MPQIEFEMTDFRGCRCIAVIDFVSSYWQLALSLYAQGLLSVITPFGVLSPTRTLQGAKNSAVNFQAKVEPCFAEIGDMVKGWLDDFIVYTASEDEHLATLRKFFEVCERVNLKISAKKTTLFTTEAKWCGRIINGSGSKLDPRHVEGLSGACDPVTADELSQFVNCAQWMSQCIPDFATRVQPLRDMLEDAYERSGQKKAKKLKRFTLKELGWSKKHQEALESLKEALREAVWLSHYDPSKPVCIFTDASEEHWAAVVTHCNEEDLSKQLHEQKQEPLAFLGSAFKGAARDWSTIEKEGFAIFQTFKKMDYILMGSASTHVHTDHRNLLFVFNPRALEPKLGRHVVSKLQRWALFLLQFEYCIEHVRGEANVMADMMTRWFKGYRGKRKTCMVRRVQLVQEEVISPRHENFDWPSVAEIVKAQTDFKSELPDSLSCTEGVYHRGESLWIPNSATELQLKLLTVAHCGEAGHRKVEATKSRLRENFFWDNMAADCEAFVRNCLHCFTSHNARTVPRPLASTLHASKPGEVLHFDYLYLGKGTQELWYALLLKDDFSSYSWLSPCKSACTENVSDAIARWIRTFTAMSTWVSDKGSHFKNEVLEKLAVDFDITHHFTIAYSPWSNGTVESLCQEVLRVLTAIRSERRLAPHDWPQLIGTVQTAINEAPVVRLGKREDGTYRTPLEVMTGIRPRRNYFKHENIEFLQGDKAECSIATLLTALEKVHKEVSESVQKERDAQRRIHNSRTGVSEANFSKGDFVMVRQAGKTGHKLEYRWVGPRVIEKVVSAHVFAVKNLASGKVSEIHATRLRFFSAPTVGTDAPSYFVDHAEHTEAVYDTVEKVQGVREVDKVIWIQVQWEGPEEKKDVTWHTLTDIHGDIPEMVVEFLRKSKSKVARKALRQIQDSK